MIRSYFSTFLYEWIFHQYIMCTQGSKVIVREWDYIQEYIETQMLSWK